MRRREFLGSAAFLLAGATTSRIATAWERMDGMTLKTLDGRAAAIDASAVTELKTGLHGDFLIDGMPEYESARHVWNAAINRRPAIIIRCADADDIARAVLFAKRQNAILSVRAGGHNQLASRHAMAA